MARVFISYRRIDSKWAVGRLYDRLAEVLKRENLFLDVSDIEPGDDYVDRIQRIIGTCDVLLAVIGRSWLTAQDTSGRRRLDDPGDLVRVEIATALDRGIRVVPILVDDASMPKRHDLPEDLIGLSRRNAKVVSFTDFHSDLDSLLRVLEKVLDTSPGAKVGVGAEPTPSEAKVTTGVNIGATELPLTICIETMGGVATPLIERGTKLPAKNSQTFSTSKDNQSAISVRLSWGERANAKDNLELGEFDLEGIHPALRGKPQIEITTAIDRNLVMTVITRDLDTGQTRVLDAVDLSRLEIPDDMLKEVRSKPKKAQSPRDFQNIFAEFDDVFGRFADVFAGFDDVLGGGVFKNQAKNGLDVHRTVRVKSTQTENEIKLRNGLGQLIRGTIPAGVKDGQRLRFRQQGKSDGNRTGDLYVVIRIDDASK
jgi:hypothetical protein